MVSPQHAAPSPRMTVTTATDADAAIADAATVQAVKERKHWPPLWYNPYHNQWGILLHMDDGGHGGDDGDDSDEDGCISHCIGVITSLPRVKNYTS